MVGIVGAGRVISAEAGALAGDAAAGSDFVSEVIAGGEVGRTSVSCGCSFGFFFAGGLVFGDCVSAGGVTGDGGSAGEGAATGAGCDAGTIWTVNGAAEMLSCLPGIPIMAAAINAACSSTVAARATKENTERMRIYRAGALPRCVVTVRARPACRTSLLSCLQGSGLRAGYRARS